MTIEQINSLCENTLISLLEIEFLDYGKDFIVARMPVNTKIHQPAGIMHGGASLVLAETVAGAGSMLQVDSEKYNVFGSQVSGNHLSSISSGEVTAKAELIYKGQLTHVWDVKITDNTGKLISVSRVTNIVKEKS